MFKLLKIAIYLSFFVIGIKGTHPAFAANVPQIKIENFVKLPGSRDVQISPDGQHLSVVFRKGNEDMLGVLELKTRKILNAFSVRGIGKSVGRVNWVNNERLVYSVTESYGWDKALRDNGELIGVNIDGSKHVPLFGYRSGQQKTGSRLKSKKADYGHHEIIDILPNDDENILITFYPWKFDGRYWRTNHGVTPSVYKLNVLNGKKRIVTSLPMVGASAVTDNNGEVRFAMGVNKRNELELAYRDSGDDDWQDFRLDNFEGDKVVPQSFTADNQSVYLTANVGNGTRALYTLNLKDKTTNKIFHNPEVDISQFVRDFSDRKIVAIGTELALPEYQYLDKKDPKAKIHKALMSVFEGYDVVITSATEKGDFVIAFAYSDVNPGDYYLLNTKTMKADFLLTERDKIEPSHMAFMEPMEFKTRDDVTLYGYLTKPRNAKGKMPLVVLPHGGPHGIRDSWGFDWEVQLLANHGFAVLQVNYRGSGGFGTQFGRAGHGKWGTLMQDDVTDATRSVIDSGIADPDKICIYGASYGGYAAMMGAAREPELYQCAIGSIGVYDLPMMFEEGDVAERDAGLAYLKEVLGDDIEDQKSRSPVHNVDKIKANILLIHGAKDNRAPIEQAESLKDAFDDIGKDYEWLKLSNEGHGYYDEGNRLKVYSKILEFLKTNIGKEPVQATAN